jgi:hypothetical protein
MLPSEPGEVYGHSAFGVCGAFGHTSHQTAGSDGLVARPGRAGRSVAAEVLQAGLNPPPA